MPLTQRRNWLIAYDIRDPRRLARLHNFIKRHAVPVQYSVYLFSGHAGHLGQLLAEIRHRIDIRVDDVRAYLVPEGAEVHTLGRGALPIPATLVSEGGPYGTMLMAATSDVKEV